MRENKKEIKGYKIDYKNNQIVMNYKFAEKAQHYGTEEYTLLKNILFDYPQMNKVVKSGREQKKTRPNKRLTYENMKLFIEASENAEKMLKKFENVRKKSKAQKSPYKYVLDWYLNTYKDDYTKTPNFEGGKVIPKEDKKKELAVA